MPRIERDIAQLKAEVAQRPLPRHVGIIMDGNGRWAEQRGLPRLEGHRRGSDSVREVTRAARRLGLNALTLYAFSSQNWERPPDEVAGLMDLLRDYLNRERPEIMENGIRLHAIGELDRLPSRVRDPLSQVQVAFDEQWHYPRFLRTSMLYPDGWSMVVIRGLHPL